MIYPIEHLNRELKIIMKKKTIKKNIKKNRNIQI